jgi:hypothetical protein
MPRMADFVESKRHRFASSRSLLCLLVNVGLTSLVDEDVIRVGLQAQFLQSVHCQADFRPSTPTPNMDDPFLKANAADHQQYAPSVKLFSWADSRA